MTGLPSQYRLITNAIEFAREHHQVISQNVANVNTPEYKARTISFDEFLASGKSGSADFTIEYVQGLPTRNDGNNVDMDRELANLKKNAMAHQTLTQLLGTQISIMQRAISG
jgi:flagellar basal-body rod protein FlgB